MSNSKVFLLIMLVWAATATNIHASGEAYLPSRPEIKKTILSHLKRQLLHLVQDTFGPLHNSRVPAWLSLKWKDEIRSGIHEHNEGNIVAKKGRNFIDLLCKRIERDVYKVLNKWNLKGDIRINDLTEIGELVDRQVTAKIERYFDFKQYGVDAKGINNKEYFLFKIPAWPFVTNFYARNDLIQVELSVQWASDSWSSGGSSKDMAQLVFGEPTIHVQDILLASKLLNLQEVNAAVYGNSPSFNPLSSNQYLAELANQVLVYDASFDKETLNLNYARRFREAGITFGFQIPIVRRQNNLEFASAFTDDTIELLASAESQAAGNFFKLYTDLNDFVNDILHRKGISSRLSSHQIGIGDITTFLNVEIRSSTFERSVMGGSFKFPSSRERNTHKLWDAELGDTGYSTFSLFWTLMYGFNRFFNPHFFFQGSVSPITRVERRVPQQITYNGVSPAAQGQKVPADFILFGEQIAFINPFGPIDDSTVRNFSDKSQRIKIRRGPEFEARVGNIFEQFLLKKAFLDLFYDFRAKGRERLGFNPPNKPIDGGVVIANTYQVEHRAGARFTYEFDRSWRANIDFLYTFAGRNVPETFEFVFAVCADI